MPADISDVATVAGVSTATVSRALRGLPNVSEATRQKVLVAAASLDYVSSPSASRLASGQTHSVGVVAPYLGRWFFGQVLSGAERVLREAGYDVLLYALPDDAARKDFFDRMPLRRRVDAVLILTLPLTEAQIERLRQLDVPIGAVGERFGATCQVGIDDRAAARTATNHLINLGHRHIAMIGAGASLPTHFTVPDDRRDGYREAMAAAGLAIEPGYEVDGSFTADGGGAAMAQLMSLPLPPSAVFAQSDEMALGAIKALRWSGLDCPRDVSVVGFDDHELAALMDLTTVSQPVELQGQIAARQILAAIAGGAPSRETVPTRLVVRSSTRPPRDAQPRGATAVTARPA